MKITIEKIKILKKKQDKNSKGYAPCVIESAELQFPYWYNIYKQDDPVLKWQAGQEVNIEIADNGQWHNFKPSEVPYGGKAARADNAPANLKDLKELELYLMQKLEDLRLEMGVGKVISKRNEIDPNLPF